MDLYTSFYLFLCYIEYTEAAEELIMCNQMHVYLCLHT